MVASTFVQSISPKCLSHEHFVDKLIRLYRANECLWNPRSSGYQNTALKENAWLRISRFFNHEITVDQLKLAIISLRHLYERERLMKTRKKLRQNLSASKEECYEEMQFLENTEDSLKAIEAHTKLGNSQINCLVEDTFLLSKNSQKSMHSDQVDFELPSPLAEDEAEVSDSKAFSVSFPYPLRELSGNDRAPYSKPNYNTAEEDYEEFRRRHSRSPATSSKIKMPRPKSNYSVNSEYGNQQASRVNLVKKPYDHWLPVNTQTSVSQPKRKVLTGRYCKPNSRQRLNDYMYDVKVKEIQNSQNKCTPHAMARKKSGNDEAYRNESKRMCPGGESCNCCPQIRSARMQYMGTGVEEEVQPAIEENFQTPEPTSEDYEPAQPPVHTFAHPSAQPPACSRNACRNETCPVKMAKAKMGPSSSSNVAKPPAKDYEKSEQRSVKEDVRYCENPCVANRSAIEASSRNPEPLSDESYNRERPPKRHEQQAVPRVVSTNASRLTSPRVTSDDSTARHVSEPLLEESYERKRPSKRLEPPAVPRQASRNASRQTSPRITSDDSTTIPRSSRDHSDWPESVYYCCRNLNQIDDYQKNKYVECPKTSRRHRQRQRDEDEPMDDRYSQRRRYQDEYDEQPSQRYSKNSRPSESPRVTHERSYDDRSSRRRQSQPEAYEDYQPRTSDRYARNSAQQSHTSPVEKFSARASTKSDQRSYVLDRNLRSGSENSSEIVPQSLRNYYRRSDNNQQPLDFSENDESCSCSSDENETITPPDYVEESLEEYPHVTNDPTRRYAEESLGDLNEDPPQDCNDSCFNECSYVQRSSKSSRRGRDNRKDYLQDCNEGICTECPHSQRPPRERYQECNEDTFHGYVERKDTFDLEVSKKTTPCYCDMAVETEIDMTLNNRRGPSSTSKPIKPAKKTKTACKCSAHRSKSGRSTSPMLKSEVLKQRMSAPMGKLLCGAIKRLGKLDDEQENKLQAHVGQQPDTEHYDPGSRKSSGLYRHKSGLETVNKTVDGVSVLGHFQVPSNLVEKTINIVKQHINQMAPKNMTREAETPTQRRRSASCTEPIAGGAFKVRSNPFRNINFDVSKRQIIILHPPVEDFRPSKYSFSLQDVDVSLPKSTTKSTTKQTES